MAHKQDVARAIARREGGGALAHVRRLVRADVGDEPVHAPGDVLGGLAAGAAVPPDVPLPLAQALLPPHPADLGARDALVVAVVPLADVLRHLDARVAGGAGPAGCRGPVGLPGQGLDAQVEQLKGALGTLARGDVAVVCVSTCILNGDVDEVGGGTRLGATNM